jgi:hypothetical protein
MQKLSLLTNAINHVAHHKGPVQTVAIVSIAFLAVRLFSYLKDLHLNSKKASRPSNRIPRQDIAQKKIKKIMLDRAIISLTQERELIKDIKIKRYAAKISHKRLLELDVCVQVRNFSEKNYLELKKLHEQKKINIIKKIKTLSQKWNLSLGFIACKGVTWKAVIKNQYYFIEWLHLAISKLTNGPSLIIRQLPERKYSLDFLDNQGFQQSIIISPDKQKKPFS